MVEEVAAMTGSRQERGRRQGDPERVELNAPPGDPGASPILASVVSGAAAFTVRAPG